MGSDAFQGYIEKMGSNFLVAAMIPSLAFTIVCIIVFEPITNISKLLQNQNSIYNILGFSLFLFIPTVIIGFTLTALNTYILKLFEGYILLHHLPFARKRQLKKAKKLKIQREFIKKRIERLGKKKSRKNKAKISLLKSQYYSIAAEYDRTFPTSTDHILPTGFGNILKAAEEYPATRYGIDSVTLWPRLIHVIPDSFHKNIDESSNELSFLVNLSVLSFSFSVLCSVAATQNFIISVTTMNSLRFFQSQNTTYIMASFLSLIIAWLFYKASLFSVGSFGLMIRTAYDLFRQDLLKQLKLPIPDNSIDEFYTWKNIGEFIALGGHSLEFEMLKYDIKKEQLD